MYAYVGGIPDHYALHNVMCWLFFFMLLSSQAAASSFVQAPSIGDRHLVAVVAPVPALPVVAFPAAYPAAFPSTPAASPSPFPIEALQMAYCCVQGR